jgi:uncharacterized membrane protein
MRRFVTGFVRFWWGFIVGDDWRIAVGVVVVLGIGAVLVARDASQGLVAALTAAGIMLVAIASIVTAALRASRR